MIILGVILLVVGFLLAIPILWTLGIILVVVGVILVLLGSAGHAIGGPTALLLRLRAMCDGLVRVRVPKQSGAC